LIISALVHKPADGRWAEHVRSALVASDINLFCTLVEAMNKKSGRRFKTA
jgi:hypothetical protein